MITIDIMDDGNRFLNSLSKEAGAVVKRTLFFILMSGFLLASAGFSRADSFWKTFWKPGEYTVALTPEEDKQITEIMKEADRRSAGTMARYGAEHESDLEGMYEGFLQLSPDGSPIVNDRQEYDDIGYYRWAVGLPDESSVSWEEAWKITIAFLLDRDLAKPETLVCYYPMYSYETGNDPGNPVWIIIPACCGASDPQLPLTPWEVAVYAHDGSICGYRGLEP